MTRIVTFYSYKGGVGRTMALVNTAHVLAREGWRVLMVDFDLEAPGMTYFFRKDIDEKSRFVHKDAVDLLADAKRTLDGPKELIPISLKDYVIGLNPHDNWLNNKRHVTPYQQGRLDLIPATLDPIPSVDDASLSQDYLARLDALDLAGIFAEKGPRHEFGKHLRQYFRRARFQAPGDPLFALRTEITASYDIILVDSRTGFNEVAGLCIGPLCDSLVVCCALNEQNVSGTRYFLNKAGLFGEKAKPVLVSAGPVPVWQTQRTRTRLEQIRQELRTDELIVVPYHPVAALAETVFVQEESEDPIAKSYVRLANRLASRELRFTAEYLPEILFSASSKEWGKQHWEAAATALAARLSFAREGVSQDIRERRQNTDPIFPTGFCLLRLPERSDNPQSTWGRELALVAAVSACRQSSDLPFEIAWQLLGGENYDVTAAISLIFFQLLVRHTFPKDPRARTILTNALSDLNGNARVLGQGLRHFGVSRKSLSPADIVLTGMLANAYGENIANVPSTAKFFKQTEELDLSHYNPYVDPSWMHDGMTVSAMFVLYGTARVSPRYDELVTSFNLKPLLGLDRKTRHRNLQASEVDAWSSTFQSDKYDPVFPQNLESVQLGAYLEPAVASALAAVEGVSAMPQIIWWLKRARMRYGYAWRILLNWDHFHLVENDSRFTEFVRQEDELVDQIEGLIDRGHFTI